MRAVEGDERGVGTDPEPVAVRERVVSPAVDGVVVPAGAWQLVRERREGQAAAARARQRAIAIPPYELTVFADGRAIVKGTKDPAVARSLYARYIGA